jgi:hypothetical protein
MAWRHQVVEEVERRPVGPVNVFEYQRNWCRRDQIGEELFHGVEQPNAHPRLVRWRGPVLVADIGQLGQHAPQLGGHKGWTVRERL